MESPKAWDYHFMWDFSYVKMWLTVSHYQIEQVCLLRCLPLTKHNIIMGTIPWPHLTLVLNFPKVPPPDVINIWIWRLSFQDMSFSGIYSNHSKHQNSTLEICLQNPYFTMANVFKWPGVQKAYECCTSTAIAQRSPNLLLVALPQGLGNILHWTLLFLLMRQP